MFSVFFSFVFFFCFTSFVLRYSTKGTKKLSLFYEVEILPKPKVYMLEPERKRERICLLQTGTETNIDAGCQSLEMTFEDGIS